jgi:hypothetical protein
MLAARCHILGHTWEAENADGLIKSRELKSILFSFMAQAVLNFHIITGRRMKLNHWIC